MRIAIVTETFAPDVNGVAHSVERVAEHLHRRGHRPLVIAPEPALGRRAVAGPRPYPVVRLRSVPLPGYGRLRLGLPGPKLREAIVAHAPDAVHLASPFVLGARGVALAERAGVPTVAVYQTDVPAYTHAYRLGGGEPVAWHWIRTIHNGAARTLAPSTACAAELAARGVRRVELWGRGVDVERFHPGKRSAALRAALAPGGETIVGYVGRLAIEKRLDLLAPLHRMPGVRLVIVGAGPRARAIRRVLPGAVFLGERHGEQLARIVASLDVFVHPGPHETFGQAIQEAMASGVPVVAPDAGGPRDLVRPGRTGLLVPPGDAGPLAAAVRLLVADPEVRQGYAVAAREAVLGRTWAALGDELIGHYTQVLGGRYPVPDLARWTQPAPAR